LWISTSGGLTRFQHEEFKLFTTNEGLPANSVWSVYQGRDGSLWALTTAGVGKLAGGRFHPLAFSQGLSSAIAIGELCDGSLCVNSGTSLLRIDPAHMAVSTVIAGSEQIQAVALDAHGAIWIGSHSGLKTVTKDGAQNSFRPPDGLGADV